MYLVRRYWKDRSSTRCLGRHLGRHRTNRMKYINSFLIASFVCFLATGLAAPLLFPPIEMCPMMPGMTMAEMNAMTRQDPSQEQEPPQETPPTTPGPPEVDPELPPGGHTEPTEFCTPINRPDGKSPCTCLMQFPEGCREGKREIEHRSCNSWCWKAKCKCCSS